MTKTQLRGICQCCGRQQAVLASGNMSKHGYTVEQGWFSGVCRGQNHQPLQLDRTQADRTVQTVRHDVARLQQNLLDLQAGKIFPEIVNTGRYDFAKQASETVSWADANEYQRTRGVEVEIFRVSGRIRLGTGFADDLEALANNVFGTALLEVKAEAAPAPILAGERRQSEARGILTAVSVFQGMVKWKDERGYGTKMSTRAWRNLPAAQ